MSISRRTALATGAAAIVTGAAVAPLAFKAAGVKAALGGDPVLALEREWRARLDYVHNYPDDSDAALDPLYERVNEIERQLFLTPAESVQGVLTKLRVWHYYYSPGSCADQPYDRVWWRGNLDNLPIADLGSVAVMRDLERLAGEVGA